MKFTHFPFKSSLLACSIALLCCVQFNYLSSTKTIEKIDPQKGYRLENAMQQALQKENLVIADFSGGGPRGIFRLWRVRAVQNVSVRPTRKVAPYCKILILCMGCLAAQY